MTQSDQGAPSDYSVRLILISLIGAALAFRLWLSLTPLDQLVGLCLSDDSFYYFQIARNIAGGQGATFDGVIPTNGFHPLYMMLLVPLYWIWPANPVMPVHIALFLLSLANVFTALPIYYLLRRFTGSLAALVAAFFWLSNPWSIFISLTGVEIALAVFLLGCVYVKYLSVLDDPDKSGRGLLGLGLLAGLTLLGRTDMVLLLLPLGVGLAIRLLSLPVSLSLRLRKIGVALGGALAVVLPWAIWNLKSFGTLMQTSGAVLFFRAHSQVLLTKGDSWSIALSHGWDQLLVNLERWLLRLAGFRDPRTIVLIVLFILVWAIVFRLMPDRDEIVKNKLTGLPEIVIGLALHWLFYAALFWQVKSWYFLPAVLGLTIGVGFIVQVLFQIILHRKSPLTRIIVLLLISAFFFAGHLQKINDIRQDGFNPWQRTYLAIGQKIARNEIRHLGPSDTIGSFNCGIIGYFAGRRIINLDGVVNNRVLPAMRQGRFYEYLQQEKISHLIDHQDLILEYDLWSGPQYLEDLNFITRLGKSAFAGDISLVRLGQDNDAP